MQHKAEHTIKFVIISDWSRFDSSCRVWHSTVESREPIFSSYDDDMKLSVF